MSREVERKGYERGQRKAAGEVGGTELARAPGATAGTPAYLQRAVDGGAVADREPTILGPRDDPLEREAERVADAVAAGSRDASVGAAGRDATGAVRRSGTSGAGDAGAPPALQRALEAPGAGTPLPQPVRERVEPVVGRGLSDVRVHDDAASHAAAKDIGAKAFTRGSDVWLGAGESAHDSGLMAHEATHVAQQADGVVRRSTEASPAVKPPAPGGASDSPEAGVFKPRTRSLGWIEKAATGKGGTIHLPELYVPFVGKRPKVAQDHPHSLAAPAEKREPILTGKPWTFIGPGARGSKTARQAWLDEARQVVSPHLREKLEKMVKGAGGASTVDARGPDRDLIGLVLKKSRLDFVLLGTIDELAGARAGNSETASDFLLIPVWSARGKKTYFDVDHAQEIQLGGFDGWKNFWLWEMKANRSSGRNIFDQMKKQVDQLTNEAVREGFWADRKGGKKAKSGKGGGKTETRGASGESAPEPAPSFEEVRQAWTIQVAKLSELSVSGEPESYWSRAQITAGEHLDQLRLLSGPELAEMGVGQKGGKPKELRIFTEPNGGAFKRIPWKDAQPGGGKKQLGLPHLYGGFDITHVTYDNSKQDTPGAEVGKLHGAPFRIKKRQLFQGREEIAIPFRAAPALGFGGYIDQKAVREIILGIEIPGMSPVAVDFAGISPDGNLTLEGRIVATKKLFPGLEIPISVVGTDVRVDFPIPVEKLSLGPVRVTQAYLRLTYGEDGLAFGGGIDFAVDGLGQGLLRARGRDFEGSFELDFDWLDPARVEVAYKDDAWSGAATLGLRKGALPGVEAARVDVGIGPEGPKVAGALTLGVGPFRGIELLGAWDREEGLTIGVEEVALPVAKVPGLDSATASVHVRRSPAGLWSVSGGGTATFGLKGVGGQLSVALDGDRITIAGTGKLERGLLTGAVSFLISNAPRDEVGEPTEGEPTDEMIASGSGSATIAFGKLLRGTVGLTVQPNGEVVLRGEIGLPPRVPVFEPWTVDRELFRPPPLDIPILGVAAAGKRIGIFATVSGGLSAQASIGPGVLEDTKVGIEFNPDRQEDTRVQGQASFVVPAAAGLRLAVRGGLGAGIPIVSATAGIEVGGRLGIAAEARTGVELEWSPQKGLVLDAVAKIEASPKFTFDVSAFVDVELDLWLKTISLYENRWKLAAFEFGPSMRFGVEAPVRWSEEGGLELSYEAIRIQRPQIDMKRIATDLVAEVVG